METKWREDQIKTTTFLCVQMEFVFIISDTALKSYEI